jgi:autophagy-related protein 101
LHTIFFHRFFTALQPASHDVLDLTLPYVSEDEVENLIEQRTNTLLRQLDATSTQSSPQYQPKAGRGQVVVQFLEKKRKKTWFVAKADEETVWESWVVDVTLTSARSEPEASRNRIQMEKQLQAAAMKIVTIVNKERNHIPPITTNDSPFPYQILVNTKGDGWSQRTSSS